MPAKRLITGRPTLKMSRDFQTLRSTPQVTGIVILWSTGCSKQQLKKKLPRRERILTKPSGRKERAPRG